MTPPDKTHLYELHVFALDKLLNLKSGFLLNDLYHLMEGHNQSFFHQYQNLFAFLLFIASYQCDS